MKDIEHIPWCLLVWVTLWRLLFFLGYFRSPVWPVALAVEDPCQAFQLGVWGRASTERQIKS